MATLAGWIASAWTPADGAGDAITGSASDPVRDDALRLCAFLRSAGLGAGEPVAVAVRDAALLPATLAALVLARAKIQLLDATVAPSSLLATLARHAPVMLLTETALSAHVIEYDGSIVQVDGDRDYWCDLPAACPPVAGEDAAIGMLAASGELDWLAMPALLAQLAQPGGDAPASGGRGMGETVLAALRTALGGHAPIAAARPATAQTAAWTPLDAPLLLCPERDARQGGHRASGQALPAALSAAILDFARARKVDAHVVLTTAWAALLHRHAGARDIRIACWAATPGPAIEAACTFAFAADGGFDALLAQGAESLSVDRHGVDRRGADNAGDALLATLRRESDEAFNRICQFGVVRGPATERMAIELAADFNLDVVCGFDVDADAGTIHCRLAILDAMAGQGLHARLLDSFAALIGHCLADPAAAIDGVPVLSAGQHALQVDGWNDTSADYAREACIHHLFERAVAAAPDAVAVEDDRGFLRYGELNAQANRLARFLRSLAGERSARICVMLDRRVDMPMTLLAILKSGHAYVPLDVHHPAMRNADILRDHDVAIVVTHLQYRDALSAVVQAGAGLSHVVYVDAPADAVDALPHHDGVAVHGAAAWAAMAGDDPRYPVASDDLAYIIFTSGSTGKPKGVRVRHRPVINLIEWVNREFSVGADDRLLFVTSLSFDLSVYDIFGMLAAGGTIRVASHDAIRDANALLHLLKSEAITFWDSAPANLQRLVPLLDAGARGPEYRHLRLVFLSGDWIPVKLPDALRATFARARVISLGGATEATVWSNYYPIGSVGADWGSIPYGRPIQNARYYILNAKLQPCPVGVPGDLYIGGECLADGYTSDALTRASFIADPFVSDARARMYRTGDLARFEADGTMIFLGRADTQVKVRGFRIELGEIEAVLQRHEAVDHAVVLVQDRSTPDPRIVAYVASRDSGLDHATLRRYLADYLPETMLPNFTWVMPVLPVNANGKVDRAGLPWPLPAQPSWDAIAAAAAPVDPGRATTHAPTPAPMPAPAPASAPANAPTAPRADRDAVRALVGELLHNTRIDENASLFEAGATSLTIVFLADRIKQSFGVDISIDVFLREPTLSALYRWLGADAAPEPAHAPVDAPVDAPVRAADATDPSPVATSAIDQTSATSRATTSATDAIAIIGMRVQLPGADGIDALWQRLSAGEAFYGPLPSARRALWFGDAPLADASAFAGAYLDDIDAFDHRFFGVSAPEARSMDPQERRLMEAAWHCIEDAGYRHDDPALGRVGVYCGIMREDYAGVGVEQWRREGVTAFASNGSGVSNRISHALDFRGPSLTVNTSCASGMTALHLACEALRHGECDTALVGAVNLLAHPYHQAMLRNLGFSSRSGVVAPFSSVADGWVPGEGVIAFLLKPSARARADRDPIHAHLSASGIGHMGKTVQYAAPSGDAQREGLRDLLDALRLGMRDIDLIECAAAGAPIGDAAEYTALQSLAQGEAGTANALPRLGTSKDYFGHLESVSALAQIAKVIAQLRHDTLVPMRGDAPLGALVASGGNALALSRQAQAWLPHDDGHPRRALVNCNGAGGATAHLLVEEHRDDARADASMAASHRQQAEIVALSAGCAHRLRALAEALLARIVADEEAGRHDIASLQDIAFTLACGRTHGEHRVALVAESRRELSAQLRDFLAAPARDTDDRLDGGVAVDGGFAGIAGTDAPRDIDAARVDGRRDALLAVARDWVTGAVRLDRLAGTHAARGSRRARLPGYRFEAHRHWLPVAATSDAATSPAIGQVGVPAGAPVADDAAATALRERLVALVSEATETPVDAIRLKDNTQRYGFNSLNVAFITERLGAWLGVRLEPTLFFEHKTLGALADALTEAHGDVLAQRGDGRPGAMSDSMSDVMPSRARALDAVPDVPAAMARQGRMQDADAPMAIVGMAGRYPGADDLTAFWTNLRDGRDCIGEIPVERWNVDDYLPDGVPRPATGVSRWGGFIRDVDKFDPLFFGIAPATADIMDPQVRLFLQCAWETLEDAGHSPDCLKRFYDGAVGVFVGAMHAEYQLHQTRDAEGRLHMGGMSLGSIAHQVSYSLDLGGPSMAIDTMCSASLTALHLAIDSIRRGECAAALVGGINLSIHPNKYIHQSLMTMHSSSGRCMSFGADGDGFVPAEGVGAILVKPLDAARRDRDQIHAVILGSALNSGGKTYGYTVPSATAQADLVVEALRRASVDPIDVSYIEAHGTGTSLGDPIEIKGLTRAFLRATRDPEALRRRGQFCAIGSVKSNIGHCESAAGIAGLTKLLLQMRHETLVPSLHAERLNPSIDFAGSPFRVQRTLAPWRVEGDGSGAARRIAAISSFGAGGANAHVVLAQHRDAVDARAAVSPIAGPMPILLSARTATQLTALAERIEASVAFHGYTDADLPSIAFTLAVGRETFAHRLALVVEDLAGLRDALRRHVRGESPESAVAVVRRGTGHAVDDGFDAADLFARRAWDALAGAWLAGADIDWWALYATLPGIGKRSLATYPFQPRSCWLGGRFEPCDAMHATQPGARLHPLLHENASDLAQVRYRSVFAVDHPVLRDHVLGGRCILPGAAQLEMARAAVERAAPALRDAGCVRLRNIVWMQPMLPEDGRLDAGVELESLPDGVVRFRLTSRGAGGAPAIHSQGEALALAQTAPRIDLPALRALCADAGIDNAAFYRQAREGGAEYGPWFQALDTLWCRTGEGAMALARLRVRPVAGVADADLVLHPARLDAAWQAVAALSAALSGGRARMALPFAIDALDVHAACPGDAWACVRPSTDAVDAAVQRYDIDIADDDGRVCVAVRGYTVRAVGMPPAASPGTVAQRERVRVLQPAWVQADAQIETEIETSTDTAIETASTALPRPEDEAVDLLCLVGMDAIGPEDAWRDVRVLSLAGDHDGAVADEAVFRTAVLGLLDACRGMAGKTTVRRRLCVALRCAHPDSALMTGLSALLATIGREYPAIETRLLGFDVAPTQAQLRAALRQCFARDARDHFHASGRMLSRTLSPSPDVMSRAPVAWQPGEVVLVTGGLGGIGRLLLRHLAGRGVPMTVIALGRAPLDRGVQDVLDALQAPGLKLVYDAVDLSDAPALSSRLADLRACYGPFTRVFHCAGANHDSYIANKTAAEVDAVFASKVAGLAHLDRATRSDPLASFVAFSSISSLFGNPGQADYAAANGYMDGYMLQRARAVAEGAAQGVSSAVNWPFWRNGGMRLGEAALAEMARSGIAALEDEDGLAVLERLAMSASGQWAVLPSASPVASVPATVASPAQSSAQSPAPSSRVHEASDDRPAVADAARLAALREVFIAEMSAQLKIDRQELDVDTEFGEFGFDSISLTEYANRVNAVTGLALMPTIFFEHPTIEAIARHAASLETAGATAARSPGLPPAAQPAPVAHAAPSVPPAASAATAGDTLERALHARMLSEVSSLLKIDAAEIDLDTEFGEYGFDSISLTQLGNRVAEFTGAPVMPTVFFEHPTLRGFSAHLLGLHGPSIADALRVRETAPAPAPAPAPVAMPAPAPAPAIVQAPVATGPDDAAAAQAPIAIIGMSGTFPGAADIDAFWHALAEGVDGIGEIPSDRWDWRALYGDPMTEPNRTNVKWGGFIDGVGDFDPAFFGISPREALYMDPQQRLLMLHVWHAIEEAGHAPQSLAGSDTAIFVGTTVSGYITLVATSGHAIQSFSATGASPSVGPNRISFMLDLHGPSEPIETACSSSLVAIHRAVMTLRAGECGLAIAGGVNTIVTPDVHISFNKAGMLSTGGRCRAFSSDADGYSRGEGVGVLVLKRLADAERDHDHVHGVIRVSVINHGGKANTLTSPNPAAQSELLRRAYADAGFDPRTVGYIECHGTGTPLGDPIEINALKNAFSDLYRDAEVRHGAFAQRYPAGTPGCALASVKSNIGHLEYAAGVAGVIKVLLQMKHGRLVRSLHAERINPYIDLAGSPFEILSSARDWTRLVDADGREAPRRAGVSSFGFGGVNAHVVIEEHRADGRAPDRASDRVGRASAEVAIVLSARTDDGLKRQARRLRDAVAQRGLVDADLADIAYTLQVGRNPMRLRFACCVDGIDALLRTLDAFLADEGRGVAWLAADSRSAGTELTALLGEDDVRGLAAEWVKQGRLSQLIRVWVAGQTVGWAALAAAGDAHPRRISLPGYPFDLKRYWIEPLAQAPAPAVQAAPNPPSVAVPSIEPSPAPTSPSSPPRSLARPVVRLQALAADMATSGSAVPAARPALALAPLPTTAATPSTVTPSTATASTATASTASTRMSAATDKIIGDVLEVLRRSLAEALYIDPGEIDADLPFSEQGLDSVTGVEWVQAVNRHFDTKIATAEVFNYPTLRQFARHVADRASASVAGSAPAAAPVAGPAPDVVADGIEAGRAPVASAVPAGDAAAAAAIVAPVAVDSAGIVEHLRAGLKDVLFLEQPIEDLDQPFSDLGLDSVTGVEWIQTINVRYGIRLAASELFNYPTLRQLATHVATMAVAPTAPTAPTAPIEPTAPTVPTSPVPVPAPAPTQDVRASVPVAPATGPAAATAAVASASGRIAVIGMACRYADADTPAQLWDNLARGRDSVSRATRWTDCEALHGVPVFGSFLRDIDCFDPMFFKIAASEARYMDPQQRIFLEECWKAIEDAGHAGRIEGQQCGVYVGCGNGDYGALMDTAPPQAFWGNAMSVIASRISYFLDLRGPAMAIDTACSSSLVAIHLACRALLDGDVDLALAGGVTVLSTPSMLANAAGAGMLSPTGRCHSFDRRADGFVAGEGAGVLLLKRLEDAIAEGDHIHGVVCGSGINQDGLTNGITAPSALSQERLEAAVYARHGIDADSIGMVEAHGTGTILGDPIEFQALTRAFRRQTQRTGFCALGSIKSNLGHTIAAAGVAGVLKALLALKHRKLPPSLHFEEANPAIDLDGSPFRVNTRLVDWAVGSAGVRRAAVSSFGFSGTNAHLVLEEAPAVAATGDDGRPKLLVLSAQTPEQLRRSAAALAEHLEACADELFPAGLSSVAYTLATGRRHMACRLACIASTADDARQRLQAWLVGDGQGGDVLAPVRGLAGDDVLSSAAADFASGRAVDFGALFGAGQRKVSLPTYPFARERHWVGGDAASGRGLPPVARETSAASGGASVVMDEDGWLEGVYEGEISVEDALNHLQ